MSGHIIDWFFAAPGIPTPEERLRLMQRMVKTSDDIREIVIYKNGTGVLSDEADGISNTIMLLYDDPHDGEGSPMGDIDPVEFDDGTVLFMWSPAGEMGQAFYFATKDEIFALASEVVRNPTEVFRASFLPWDPEADAGEDARIAQLLSAGLAARRRRTLDAREPVQVARWVR